MTCDLCKKDFRPFKIPWNGHEVPSTVCRDCWEKKREEFQSYPKPPQTGKKP